MHRISYSVDDPVHGEEVSETWMLTLGDERAIESVKEDNGIIAWIGKYRFAGNTDWEYTVQYRTYDPARGSWRHGYFGWFGFGYGREIRNFAMKDGVITFTAKYRDNENVLDALEHYDVHYVTYDPEEGIFKEDVAEYPLAMGSNCGPDTVSVGDGYVAWGFPCAFFRTYNAAVYDQSLHSWQRGVSSLKFTEARKLARLEIEDFVITGWYAYGISGFELDVEAWAWYDFSTHDWGKKSFKHDFPHWDYIPPHGTSSYSNFVAAPTGGVAPLTVVFWDISALRRQPRSYSIFWDFGDNGTSSERSPIHTYVDPGNYLASQRTVGDVYVREPYVTIKVDEPPPTGHIIINGDSAYANSRTVTLTINHDPTAHEMRFAQLPAFPELQVWSPWEPVAPSRLYRILRANTGLPHHDGEYTIYVQFRNEAGTRSPIYSDSILVDTTPPEGSVSINHDDETTRVREATVQFEASDWNDVKMSWAFDSNVAPYRIWTVLGDVVPEASVKISGGAGEKTVYVQYYDAAGNRATYSDNINFVRFPWEAFYPAMLNRKSR